MSASFSDQEDREYAAFITSMCSECHCEPLSRRPCDGVLAGGLCDGHREDERGIEDDNEEMD